MHVKIHLVTQAEFFHQLSQLLQCIEKANTPTSIKVIWFYQPHILAHVHLVEHREFARNGVLKS